jgi:hypothetical protein
MPARCPIAGDALLKLRATGGAGADFSEAIRLASDLDPVQPLGYVNRGETIDKPGDKVAALASINKALHLASGFPPALHPL